MTAEAVVAVLTWAPARSIPRALQYIGRSTITGVVEVILVETESVETYSSTLMVPRLPGPTTRNVELFAAFDGIKAAVITAVVVELGFCIEIQVLKLPPVYPSARYHSVAAEVTPALQVPAALLIPPALRYIERSATTGISDSIVVATESAGTN